MNIIRKATLVVGLLGFSPGFSACTQSDNASAPETTQRQTASRIQAFWQWFASNKDQYENLPEAVDPDLNLLIEHLTAIEPGLAVEILAKPNADGLLEITISAEGDIQKFPLVEEIVKSAPTIEGWKVIAFRQPIAPDFTLKQGRTRLTPTELFFKPVVEQDTLNVIIYGKDFSKQVPDSLAFFGRIMLDNLMGEYNSVKRVRHYDFKDLSEARSQADLSPLTSINKFLDGYYKNRR